MSRRRPRLSECKTMQDFVRGGFAQVVPAVVDTGFRGYVNGRLILAAAHQSNDVGVNSAIRLAVPAVYTAGGFAARIRPTWAGNDGALHSLLYLRNAANTDYSINLRKSVANTLQLLAKGAGTTTLSSAAQSFAADSVHHFVGRWTQGPTGTLDLNHDGTDVNQVVQAQTLAPGTFLSPYDVSGAIGPMNAAIGPFIEFATPKTNAWVAAIQANSGAAYDDHMVLFRLMDVGDTLHPFGSDSVGFTKVAGGGAPFDLGVLAADGSSLVSGSGLVTSPQRFPDQVNALYGGGWQVRGFGVGSQTTPMMTADAAAQVDPLLSMPGEHVLFVWEGGNDMVITPSTPAEAYANLVTYCQARRAAGWRVIILTVTPRTVGGFDANRLSLNALIVAGWETFADGLADVGADATIGPAAAASDPTYYSDGVHGTAATYAIVAGIVKTAIESIL